MPNLSTDALRAADDAVARHFDEMRDDGGELVMLEIMAVAECSIDQACRYAAGALIRRSPGLAPYAFFAAIGRGRAGDQVMTARTTGALL